MIAPVRRVLFVDDESRILDSLRRVLRPQRHAWTALFAASADAALAELEAAPVDVIVTDLRMPHVDGAALLQQVSERWPDAMRIVLSGQTDIRTAMRTVRVAHHFLAKPCDTGTLLRVVARACRIRDLLADEAVRGAVGPVAALAELAPVYAALERAAADPDAGIARIAATIERDGAVTRALLELVNGSFVGLPGRVASIEQAIGYLGLNVVRALLLAHEMTCALGERPPVAVPQLGEYRAHALVTGHVARRMLREKVDADAAFMAALLHDVGKLALARRAPLHEVESAPSGVTHAEAGAYLLARCGLSHPVVEAVADHHAPAAARAEGSAAGLGVSAAVHIANVLAHEHAAPGASREPVRAALDGEYLAALGVADRLARWREIAAEQASRALPYSHQPEL